MCWFGTVGCIDSAYGIPNFMIKRLMLFGLITLLLFVIVFGWRFLQIKQAKENRPIPAPPLVAIAEVKQERWQPFYSAVGSFVAAQGIDVSNELPGKVAHIYFESGQSIEAGELLIELDSSTEKAELARLEAALNLAAIEFRRADKLIKTAHISRSDYDKTSATLRQAEAAVRSQNTLIDKKKILAPFSGELGLRQVDMGQYLPTGTSIVSLESLSPLYVDFSLPERYFAQLTVGQTIDVHVQAYPEQGFEGQVTALDPEVDPGTRSVKLRATLVNAEKRLRPGMFARIEVGLGGSGEVLTVPDSAITYNTYGDSVFVVIEQEGVYTVDRRQVKAGQTRGGRVEIVEGLLAGQTVVSAGQVKLRNGMSVRLDDKPTPGERPDRAGDDG